MNKRIIALIILVILTSLGIIVILNNKNKSYEILDNNHGQFAFYYEDDTGNFEKSLDTKWSSGDYILNISESICDGEKNPSFLSWNNDTHSVILKRNKSTKCTLYFDKVIKINYIEDLVELSIKVSNGETFAGKTILLTRDLDFQNSHGNDYENKDTKEYNDFNNDNITGKTMYEELTDTSGFGFLPIGNVTYSFEGVFDGNNHTISNLYINNVNNVENLRLGLFGVINNSEVSNLIVTGTIKNGTSSSNAGLISDARGKVKLTNLVNRINITSENYSWTVGGVIGTLSSDGNLTIENCINYGTITGGNFTGGIMGQSLHDSKVEIINSINYGEIKSSEGNNIGGLLGVGNTNTEIILENCKNHGSIEVTMTAGDTRVGGLIGVANGTTTIENSSNEMLSNNDNDTIIIVDNKGTGIVQAGGIIGLTVGQTTIINSHNSAKINIVSSENSSAIAGGIIAILTNNNNNINKVENCYNTGEISGGTRVGGIVASAYHSGLVLIINKSYNKGNLTGASETKYTSWVEVGGIFCQAWEGSKVYILNSYNTGSLNANAEKSTTPGSAAGIVEQSGGPKNITSVVVLNSFNSGNITAKKATLGVANVSTQNNLTINNVYSIGTLNGTANTKYSIASVNNGIADIQNAYYLKQDDILPINGSNTDGMYEITDEIKNNLVNILNENKNKINLSEYGEEIKDYELVNWIQGIDGYPTLEGVGN